MAEREGAAQNGQAHLLFPIHIIDQQIWAIGGIAEPRKHERCIRHETRHAGESFHKWRHRRAAKLSAFDNSANAAQARLRIRGETEGHMPARARKRKPTIQKEDPKATLYGTQGRIATPCAIRRRGGVGPYAPFAIMRFASTPIIESAAPSARDIGEIRRLGARFARCRDELLTSLNAHFIRSLDAVDREYGAHHSNVVRALGRQTTQLRPKERPEPFARIKARLVGEHHIFGRNAQLGRQPLGRGLGRFGISVARCLKAHGDGVERNHELFTRLIRPRIAHRLCKRIEIARRIPIVRNCAHFRSPFAWDARP